MSNGQDLTVVRRQDKKLFLLPVTASVARGGGHRRLLTAAAVMV